MSDLLDPYLRPATPASEAAAVLRDLRRALGQLGTELVGPLVLLTLTAAPLGLVWGLLAPKTTFAVLGDGSLLPDHSKAIDGDLWFLALMCAAGLVTGVLAYLSRRRGGAFAVGLGVGGLLAAQVVRAVGVRARLGAYPTSVRTFFHGASAGGRQVYLSDYARLRLTSATVGWGLVALAVFCLLVWWRESDDTRVSSS